MKIAIMTQPLGINYGGIMQAWALQQVLKRMGHQPITIDRRPQTKGLAYHLPRLAYRALKKASGRRKAPIDFERHLPAITQHTQLFIRKHIVMSEPLETTSQIKANFSRENYSAVIVGSDQTWRPKYSPNIGNYFLDFLEYDHGINRIAYATSFGVDTWEFSKSETTAFSILAKKFTAVSVRESSGVKLCKEQLDIEAKHALDPTLLLIAKDYELFLRGKSKSSGIFTYFLEPNSQKNTLVNDVSTELNLRIFSSQPKVSFKEDAADWRDYLFPSVEDWINGLNDADIVITDSYHGMVFSIIFQKPFKVVVNDSRGSERFLSLAVSLGIKVDNIYNEKYKSNIISLDAYTHAISEELVRLREHSMYFLRGAL